MSEVFARDVHTKTGPGGTGFGADTASINTLKTAGAPKLGFRKLSTRLLRLFDSGP